MVSLVLREKIFRSSVKLRDVKLVACIKLRFVSQIDIWPMSRCLGGADHVGEDTVELKSSGYVGICAYSRIQNLVPCSFISNEFINEQS